LVVSADARAGPEAASAAAYSAYTALGYTGLAITIVIANAVCASRRVDSADGSAEPPASATVVARDFLASAECAAPGSSTSASDCASLYVGLAITVGVPDGIESASVGERSAPGDRSGVPLGAGLASLAGDPGSVAKASAVARHACAWIAPSPGVGSSGGWAPLVASPGGTRAGGASAHPWSGRHLSSTWRGGSGAESS
jgi:hypothetical protein